MMKSKLPRFILVFVLVILIALTGTIIYIARGGLPQTSGNIQSDVNSPVEIYRDQYGVPHIIAGSMEDLFFAQGYVHAQDRLWQMDINRRGVGGKLSEILGEDQAEIDNFTLTIGFYRAAEKNYNLLEAEERALLEAYSAGVNACIKDNNGRLSPEFTLLGYEPEPWAPLDSLAIAVYMSWYLGGNMDTELFNYALVEKAGLEMARELFPEYPGYGPVIVPSDIPAGPSDSAVEDNPIVNDLIALSRLAELGGRAKFVPGLGSNNWAIHGDLTPGRGAILANDMHLGMGMPSIWHNSHLIVKDKLNVTGVMFPGIPGIIVGFNEHIAWGVTNTGPDVQDLYLLELNPDIPGQYLYMNEWADAEIIVEEFFVKGETAPREVEVMVTHHGPVISNIVDLEVPLSFRWTALEGTTEFSAILDLMQAENWDQFTTALEKFKTPAQNFVYADREGNIGYRANGLIPIRRSGTGFLPADGTTDAQEWVGYIPWDELPTLYNPPGGIIVTANHRVTDDDYPYFITSEWAPPYRAMGIWRELEDRENLTLEDMIGPQTSYFNTQAELLGDTLLGALNATELNDLEEKALAVFEDWLEEPVEDPGEAGPVIYNAMYLNMYQLTFADEMGEELYERFLSNRGATNAFDRMILSGTSRWFNNIDTAEEESRDDIITLAFSLAVLFLEEALGSNPADWKWGDLHTITMEHQVGSVAILAPFYNSGPYPVGGSFHTPANMSYNIKEPFEVTHSAPWRYMVDMSDYRALDILAGGISGHPLSDHYDDQTGLWLKGEYKDMPFEREAVEAFPEKLILTPR